MKPTNDLNLDCHVDSDFAGLWSFEDNQDPTCIMLLRGCPLMWSSKLQTEIVINITNHTTSHTKNRILH